MRELIESLQILLKYDDSKRPSHCEHDVLYFPNVDYNSVLDEDKKRLEELGFIKSDSGGFMSFRFGSC